MDNHSCDLTLKNVNIVSSNSKPTITVGEYARLVLNVVKANKLGYSGIYVPMGSQFELNGKGSLMIDCYASEGIGIGNDYDHGYGDITVDMQGSLEIISNSVESLCIGGGYNDDDSEINLRSGKIKLVLYSHNGLAVGSFNGNAIVDIAENCDLDINVSGIKVTGIGSAKGDATITTASKITLSCTGAQAVGIGVLENGDGSILIKQGAVKMKMRSAKHSCIGTMNGSINTKIRNSEIIIDSEGDEVTGIGDATGGGNITVIDSALTMKLLAGNPKDIGTATGDLQIQNSAVNSLVNNQKMTYGNN